MPEDTSTTADSSVRLVASSTLNYAVLLSLIGALLYGVWWTAHRDAAFEALVATVTAQNAALNGTIAAQSLALNKRVDDSSAADNLRISRIADGLAERLATLEKRDESRGASMSQLDTRLTRIESKLDYLTQNVTGGPRK